MKTLRESLDEHPLVMLQAIAEGHGLSVPVPAKEALAEYLTLTLARRETIERAWAKLSPLERDALLKIVAEGGRGKAYLLQREFGEIRRFGPGSLVRNKPWLAPASPLERLWYLGLVQRAFDVLGDYRGEILFIPPEIMQHLPRAEAVRPTFALEEVAAPANVADAGRAIVWDTFALISFLRREDGCAAPGGYLAIADWKHVNAHFVVPEDLSRRRHEREVPRLHFLHHLAQRAGLVKLENERLEPGPNVLGWLKSAPVERQRFLFHIWRDDKSWNELWHVESLRCEETGWRNDPVLARRKIVEHLGKCRVETWLSLAGFIAAVKQADPEFQRPDGDYDRWHIRDAATNDYLKGFKSWDAVEGALIAHLIGKPLHWLGIVAIGRAAPAGPVTAFRITRRGAACLGLALLEEVEPEPARMAVQGDFEVLVPEDAALIDRYHLERIAHLKRWDRVSTYVITRESVQRALRGGSEIERIVAFLERVSGKPLPANVAYTLREWGAKFGEVVLRRAELLQTRDEQLLQELQAQPELAAYLDEILAPTLVLVKPGQLAVLLERLEGLGYMPRVIGSVTPGQTISENDERTDP